MIPLKKSTNPNSIEIKLAIGTVMSFAHLFSTLNNAFTH
jgi:hypothetical protein